MVGHSSYFHPKVLFAYRWGMSLNGTVIRVDRRKWYQSAVVFSPNDPDEFLAQIEGLMTLSNSGPPQARA